jgi:polysaccharide biosynthesis PFTS motif protein
MTRFFILAFIKKRKRLRLRLINKGRNNLKENDRSALLNELKYLLSNTLLNNIHFPKYLLNGVRVNAELSVRQYLTGRIIGLAFNKSILYSIGANKPVRHPLPKEWRNALISNGIDVNNFISALLWHMYCFLYWGKGVLYGVRSILFLLKRSPELGRHVSFDNIDYNCISSRLGARNIINWYFQWSGKTEGLESACHSVKAKSNFRLGEINIIQTDGLPKIRKLKLLQYIFSVVYLSIYGLFSLVFRPTFSFFLEEMLKFKRTDLANIEDFSKDYLFHNSSPFYRPIWTYSAEEKGSRVLFYFYSTNNEGFKAKDGYPENGLWHLVSWSHYLVWDEFQADFIKRFNRHNSIIEEVGAIWFSSQKMSMDIPMKTISVFDVTPFRPAVYITLGADVDYYIYNNANPFLSDIQFILGKNNITMLHKMKRINKFAHKKYTRRVRQLNKKYNYIEAHPSVDALQIIQQTKACISMPFTSTALMAKLEGKPSVYYDPSGLIQKDDRAAHGVPVLSNIDELQEWVKSIGNE